MPDLALLLPILAIFLLATFPQGALGFGSGMVSMGLLPLVVPIKEAVVLVTVVLFVMNVIMVVRFRGHLKAAELVPLLIGGGLGAPLGVYLLNVLEPVWLLSATALSMLLYVAWATLGKTFDEPRGSPRWGLGAGFLGGLLGSAVGTGGPPPVLYVSWRGLDKHLATATMQTLFFSVGIVQLAGYSWTGLLNRPLLETSLLAIPAAAIGLGLGQWAFRHLDTRMFRRATLLGIACLALGILYRVVALV